MSQVKDDSVLVMFWITIWNQEFFEGFIITGPFFSICVYNATINGRIAQKKMQDTLTIGYQSAFLGVNLIPTESGPPQP